ncbi:MAG: FG-GAP-like repeat-containing protein [Methanobacteriota archaeon]
MKKILALIIIIFMLIPMAPHFIAFPQKTSPDYILNPGTFPQYATFGDVNNDGKEDILVTDFHANISIFYQKSNKSFSSTPDKILEQRYPGNIFYITNPDSTHKWCIITVNTNMQTVSIFYDNAKGLSSKADLTLNTRTQSFPYGLAVGDFNDDSKVDIVVGSDKYTMASDNSSLDFFYYPFKDDQVPDYSINLRTKALPKSIGVGDFNRDQKNDVAVTFNDINQTYLFYQTAEKTFSYIPSAILKTSGTAQTSIAVGDLNRDLKDDIAISQYPTKISIFYQLSNGGFNTNPSTTLTIPDQYANYIDIEDVNHDYRKDVIVATTSGTRLFYQKTDGTLPSNSDIVLRDEGSPTWNDHHVIAGDINKDFLNDIIITSLSNDKTYVWYQEPPTLDLGVSDVLVSNSHMPSLLLNQNAIVTAIISNSGTASTTNVTVRFLVNNTEQQNKIIPSIGNQTQVNVDFTWTCTPVGPRQIKITVDAKEEESTTENNWNFLPVTVRTPDLTVLPPIVEGVKTGGATITSKIKNIGDGTAHKNIEVRFYSQDPGGDPDNSLIASKKTSDGILPYGGTIPVSVHWANPQGDTTIWVWVDPFHNLTEENNYANNKNSCYVGTQPQIKSVRPYCQNTKIDAARMFVFSDRDIPLNYCVDDFETSSAINRTVFNLTGEGGTHQIYTDTDGNDGWNWSLNLRGKAEGDYTIAVQMFDVPGVSSNIMQYNITVFAFPEWVTDLSLEKGPLTFKFSQGVLSFKISSDGWDFFKKSDNGSGSGDDALTEGETKSETSAEFSVEFSTNWDDGGNKWTGTIEGSAGGETKSLGKSQKFGIKAEGGFTAEIGIIPSPLELKVESANVHFTITVSFSHLYGIAIPVIDKGVGIQISAQPSLTVTYGFHTEDGTVVNDNLELNFSCRLEGGLSIDVYLGGASVYGYATPRLIGRIGGSGPPFQIEVAVGAGGSAWAGPFKWSGEIEAAKWHWPSARNISYGNWTLSLRPMYGTNISSPVNNPVLSNDIYFDDTPYTASDYAGNTFALWVRNTTIPNASQIMYAINNGITWTEPQILTDSHHMESYPVIAFDAVNNKGVAAWVHNKADITRDTSYNSFKASYKDNEIYYAVYNSSNSSWGSAYALTSDNAADTLPAIAADSNGNIMLVWVNDSDGNISTPTDNDIYYSIWNTNTETWTNPSPIPPVQGPQEMDTKPAVAYNSSGSATVVWVHDEDSTISSFDDHPPEISELFTNPSSAAFPTTVYVYSKVYDDMIETQVNASIIFPDQTVVLRSLTFNATSGFYESSFSASQNGNYTISVTAEDYHHQLQHAFIPVHIGGGDSPPVITNPLTNKSLAHLNDLVTVSAQVTDNHNVNKVWANITGPVVSSITLIDPDHDTIYTGNFTPISTGVYTVQIHANDTSQQISNATAVCTVVGPMDLEIYQSKFTPGGGWTIPLLPLTDINDYQESNNPTIVYDINDTAVIAWEEKIGDPQQFIYTSFLTPGFGSCDCQTPEQAINIKYGNSEPKLIRSNNGFVMLTWKADDVESIWPDLYYSILNSTRLVSGQVGDYCTPVWGYPYRLTANGITDWKPSVTIDPFTNIVTAVWLGHMTLVNTYPTINLTEDDDDVYYEHFDFPFRMEGLNEVTRFSDGKIRKTLVFDKDTKNQTVYIDVPVYTFPHYDARMKLTGVANTIGQYPTNVSIDLGNDGTSDLFFASLNTTQTYYLNAVDEYAAFDNYLTNHWHIEALDGETDGKVTVPIRIHSDTPGIIQVSDINIGFDFSSTQRDCDQPLDLHVTPVVTGPFNQNHPNGYGDIIGYQDYSSSQSDIYVYNVTEKTITTEIMRPGDQEKPVLYRNRVAYQDNRNPTTGYDIYYYNLDEQIELPIGTSYPPAYQMEPDMDGDNIVYQDNRGGNFGIYLYNITMGAEIPITTIYENRNPAISGRYVLWQRYSGTNWEIYYEDLGTRYIGPLTRSSNDQINPDVDGDLVVWQDNSSGNWDIYLYNFSSEEERRLTTSPYDDINPSVSSSGRVTWERHGPTNTDIYLWDSTLDEVTQVDTNTSNQTNPNLFSDNLVWVDNRLGTDDLFYVPIRQKHAPVLDPIPDITVNETELIFVAASGIDPDGDAIVYSINDSRFSQDYNFFEWQTKDGDMGSYKVKITVSDCCYNRSQIVNITILDDNKPPVIRHIDNITVNETEPVQLMVFASDINDDFLFYDINSSRFNQNVNLFTWVTQEGDAGIYRITVNTSDGIYTSNQTVTITVNYGRPIYNITTLADGSSKKNLTFTGAGSITDYVSIPRNATVISATMNLTGYPVGQSVIFRDDFNDGNLAGWTINTQGSGLIQVSGTQYHSAPYSMRMYSPQGTSSLAMASNQLAFNPATTDYNVSFYFRLTTSTNHWFDVFVNTPQILTVVETGNVFTYRYGSTNVAIMTFAQNQWYHIQYVVHLAQGNYEIIVDGVYRATAPFCGGGGSPQTFVIGDFEAGSSNYGEAYWDDFIIIPLIMSDDFSDNNLNGWTVTTQGSGTVQTSPAQYHSSPYSMRMYSPQNPASKAMATYPMTTLDITKDYNVSFYFRMPTTSHHWFDVFTNPPQTTTVIDSSYQFIYRYGANNVPIMTLTPNTWYRMDYSIHPSQQTYDIYVNNLYRATAPFNGEAGNPQTFRIGDFEYGTANYGEGFWDDFIVIQLPTTQSYPLNPWLDVGNDGDHEWDHAGSFSTKEAVPDFTAKINQYLATQPPGGNVQVPLVFHSDAAGKIEISGIRISYVLPVANHPPNQPTNPSPLNESTGVSLSADLSWTCSDPDHGDTIKYDVYFGTTTTPQKVMNNQSATSYDPGILNLSTTYYWRIIAWDNHNASTKGPLWHFTTRGNSPPTPPSNPTPQNNSVGVSIDTDLSWSACTDPDGDLVTYDVFFGTATSPPKVSANQTATSYNLPVLNYNTTYYWRIIAWDNHSASTPGPLWHFTTEKQQLLLDGYCFYKNMTAVNPVSVEIINLNTSKRWQATTNNNQYSLTLIVGDNVTAGQTLRYIARDIDRSVNVTNHIVTTSDITSGAIHLNLILDIHYRDLKSFPFYISQVNTGAMIMKMMMDYLMWNKTVNPNGPPSVYSEQTLYNTYKGSDNIINGSELCGGLNTEIDDYHHGWIYGYFFASSARDVPTDALKDAVIWLDYNISGSNEHRLVNVPKLGHPYHVPIAVPTGGGYDHWMVIRGIHTNRSMWDTSVPGDHELISGPVTIYGFWLNDPKSGGLGPNTYVTAQYFNQTYFQKITVPGDLYYNKYLVITDPPRDQPAPDTTGLALNLAQTPAGFTSADIKLVNSAKNSKASSAVKNQANTMMIQVAWNAANQVLQIDEKYGSLFAESTVLKKPEFNKETSQCIVLFGHKNGTTFRVHLSLVNGALLEINVGNTLTTTTID